MAKCYLMIEDLEGTSDGDVQFQFAFDLGCSEADTPKSIDDMTPAQEAAWHMYNVLKGIVDAKHLVQMKREVATQILVPISKTVN